MANGIDWFRWHHGSVTDPKFQLIAKKAGASLPDVLAVWAYILEAASASDVRGEYTDIDVEALDCLFAFPDGRTADILAAMQGRVLAGNVVTRWNERQPKREREITPSVAKTGAQRMAEHRERKAASQQPSSQVTPSDATLRQVTPRVEKSREEKKREDQEQVNPTVEAVAPTARRRTDPADDSVVVFEYWQRVMGHQASKLDAKRVKSIKGRLADGYTVAQLCRAVDGCKYDPFSQGANDRQAVYDDIELICRDGPKVDKFIKIAERGPPNGRTSNAQQTIDNLQAYLAEHEN